MSIDSPSPSLAERVQSLKLAPDIRVPPRRRGFGWVWLLVAALAGSGGAYAYIHYAPRPEADEGNGAATTSRATAPAPERSAGGPATVLEAGGYIVPAQKVQISPKVGGQVVSLYKDLEEGTFVEAGTVLAELETTEFEFELRRTQAMVDLAKARWEELKNGNREEEKLQAAAALREAEEQLTQSEDELLRMRSTGRAASPDELTKAESKVATNRQRVEQQRQVYKIMVDGPRSERIAAAEAEYRQAVAERDKAQWRLDNTRVISPITGVILEKKAEVGNTVRPEAFSNGLSASLCDMADLTNLEVDVDISERDIWKIQRGQRCEVRTEANRDAVYRGFVARIMPVASRSKASVSVRIKIEVPADDSSLRPEMRARVRFLKPEEGPAATPGPSASAPQRPSP
ncbi:MAG TPA: efflux RND transporter periplasmic adaptor subunit [Gemmatales bacterium]|nr:efflux RND transporter periplasmic adaptor subunit [Gemmatales bacterium]HMP59437.1 efflux RND transporter periplasmic adaptor subunit [Gemmatales bacterium]